MLPSCASPTSAMISTLAPAEGRRQPRPRPLTLNHRNLMPYSQPPDRIGPVTSPVVNRRCLELLQPLVVVPAIVGQRLEPGPALLRIKPAAWQQHARCVDALLHLEASRARQP